MASVSVTSPTSSDLTMSEDPRTLRKSPRLSEEINTNTTEPSNNKVTINRNKRGCNNNNSCVSFFVGDPISDDIARQRWPYRYQLNKRKKNNGGNSKSADDDDDELVLDVKCHYLQAEIEKHVYDLGDCVYVKGQKGKKNFVGRIREFFKTMDDEDYFRVQWFFRAEDTVIEDESKSHDQKRLFLSDLMNDNPLDCIVSKVKIIQVPPCVELKPNSNAFDFYYDMKYSVDYTTFSTVIDDQSVLSSCDNMKIQENGIKPSVWNFSRHKPHKSDMALLDLYAGCGGMSTGLCLGAKLAGINLKTRWALDINESACESLRLNHPQVQIRNEPAEEFLGLLKEWDKLCKRFIDDAEDMASSSPRVQRKSQSEVQSPEITNSRNRNKKKASEEYEVANLVDICFGDPNDSGKDELHFQVRWIGYGPSDDTWEPIENLNNCQERIQEFVLKGYKRGILPRPGDVDVICGGPPCQGISGYNRHRNVDNPLDDDRNHQIVVFMDIVEFLKPTYILMENVGDILRFANAKLGRYALSRLVQLKYQARLGVMAAGCYGLPQFRLRVFLWGAHPNEKLPQFPLPTHDVVVKYGAPSKFERNLVAYDEDQMNQSLNLEKALVLGDAISDLPPVTNDEVRVEMSYRKPPETEFQTYIRTSESEMMGSPDAVVQKRCILYDHRPQKLFNDDFLRVSKIPFKKGANFRDLPGLIIGRDNVVRRDPEQDIRLPSGRLLVPDYAINYGQGKSKRPFARLWWDETVPTLLTTPDPHCQVILHPEQDRVLTIREYARLQGFPDYYRFAGSVKDRYCQIGNAVAVSIAKALGYGLGKAVQKVSGNGPLMELPPKFSYSKTVEDLKPSVKEESQASI